MKVINGTLMLGVDGPVDIRHGEPVLDISVVSGREVFERPLVNWYWATELITLIWSGPSGPVMLRIPPEQVLVACTEAEPLPVRAGDLGLRSELVLAGGDRVTVIGHRTDHAQISMANMIFPTQGFAVTANGALLQT